MENVPGRSVISNYGTPKKKVLEFLDSQLKPAMKSSWSYIKGSGDFNKKIKNISTIPTDSILVTADVVGLYGYILVFFVSQSLKIQRKPLLIVLIKNFQQKIWLKWLNLFLKTSIFNLRVKLNSRFREEQ